MISLESLCALFERSGRAVQMRKDFPGEMERAGNQDWIGLRVCEVKGFADRWSNGVGESWSNA
jgi:hypothetical protein